jgi:hypothetical protein
MVKKKDIIQEAATSLYDREENNNKKIFSEMVQRVRPDIWVLMDLLDQTGVDPFILLKIIRQVNNIAIGSKYGQVVVAIEKGVVRYVRGEDVDKIELPILKARGQLDK